MSKTVTKLLPDKLVFVSKIEGWLNDMANKGLKLKYLRPKYAVFEKTEPRDTQYCIAELTHYPTDEELKEYNKSFWDVTCRVNTIVSPDYLKRGHKFYVFESTDSYDEHPSKEVFGKRRSLLTRYSEQKYKYIYYLLLALVAFVAAYFNISEHYILFLPGVLLFLGVLFAVIAVVSYFDKIRIAKLEKDNKNLGRLEYKNWMSFSGKHKRRLALKFVCWMLVFASMLYIVHAFAEMITRSDLDKHDDFVRLEDIEGVGDKNLGITYGTYAPATFVPTFYIAEESGVIVDEEGKRVIVGYNIVYNKCTIPTIVSIAYGNCVLKRLIDESGGGRVKFTGSSHFAKIAYISGEYMDGGHSVKLCLSNDEELIYLTYRGEKTVQEIIEVIENKLED